MGVMPFGVITHRCYILVNIYYGFDHKVYTSLHDARYELSMRDDNWRIVEVTVEYYNGGEQRLKVLENTFGMLNELTPEQRANFESAVKRRPLFDCNSTSKRRRKGQKKNQTL